jgi:exopolysaccharide biosynthesis protein
VVGVVTSPAHAAKTPGSSSAIAYRKVTIGRTPAHVVQVDLSRRDVRVSVALAQDGIGGQERWSRMIERTRPAAAITGTYFNTANAVPIGSLVIHGTPVHWGQYRSALGITRENEAAFLTARGGKSSDWQRYEALIHAGPRLLTGGKTTLSPRAEGFRDPSIFQRKPRAAVGLTRAGKLLLVAVNRPIYLRDMATIMARLGARDAMALDGGSSAGLYCRGKSYVVPSRSLTNLLVIYESEARYLQNARQLAPAVRELLVHKSR